MQPILDTALMIQPNPLLQGPRLVFAKIPHISLNELIPCEDIPTKKPIPAAETGLVSVN